MLAELPAVAHPDLLVGRDTSDDAAVYRISPGLALIQTVDFFTPIVDDPETFGRIAAANALSDVYAMGGRPLLAMNIVCFPSRSLPLAVLRDVLRGGCEVVQRSGALLVGGHTVDDRELKYGLAVTGTVAPDRVVTNAGARPGDVLILTKPLGTGVLATAIKAGMAPTEVVAEAVRWMSTLNREAAEAMQEVGVHACTDVTGFGLLGHALELARASRVSLVVDALRVPLIAGVRELADLGMLPAGSFANRRYCEGSLVVERGVAPQLVDLLADAQTSGGLLIAVGPERADTLHTALERRGVPHPEVGRAAEPAQELIRLTGE